MSTVSFVMDFYSSWSVIQIQSTSIFTFTCTSPWSIRMRIALDFYRCPQNNNAIDHAVTATLFRFHDMFQGFWMFTPLLCFTSFSSFCQYFSTFFVKVILLCLQRHLQLVKQRFVFIISHDSSVIAFLFLFIPNCHFSNVIVVWE